jgi:hypothetical protein
MDDTTAHPQQEKKDNAIMFYILGGVIVTAIIVAAFLLYPRNDQKTAQQQNAPVLGQQAPPPTATPIPKGPIGSLACTTQWYNTVNGVTETYYLSVEGEAPQSAGSVSCTLTASVNNQVVATDVVTPLTNPAPDRNGFTFRCSTKGLKLRPGVPTKVVSDLKDANGVTASCSRTYLLP